MRKRLVLAGCVTAAVATPPAALAHQLTEALFDRSRTIEFIAVLDKADIINPHSWFRFDEYRDGNFVREAGPLLIRRPL